MDRSREIFICLLSAMALLVFSVVFLLAEDETVIGSYMVGGSLLLWLMVRMGAYARGIAAVAHHERLWSGLLFIAALILLFFFRDNHYCLFLIGTIFCYTIAVLGLNVQLGYTGVIKRWNQRRLKETHGVGPVHREVGSFGSINPARVFKQMHMPGQYGHERVTVQNLEVVKVDAARNALLIKGAIPGPKGSIVTVCDSVKSK